ncbi:unnamed protein product [Penicillium nalgiovense]|nr:unnamed protein product [Penicillium nalgiovense]
MFGLRIWMSTATALTTSARKLNGQHQTNFGALAAYEVPFFVIPDRFGTKYAKQLPGNNMFYGIYGDSDGDTPQVIGEASWLMARICFPDDEWQQCPCSALNKNYVTNFSTLRPMGDKLMTALAKNLKLVDGGDGGSPTTTAGSNPTSESCEGEGHCAGASCKDENDCSGHLVCKSGKCASE